MMIQIAQVNTIYYDKDVPVIYIVESTKNKIRTVADWQHRKTKTTCLLKGLLVLIKIRAGLIRWLTLYFLKEGTN